MSLEKQVDADLNRARRKAFLRGLLTSLRRELGRAAGEDDEAVRRGLCERGQVGLLSLLSEDMVFYSDGGGKVVTARNPVYGPDRIARLMLRLARTRWPEYTIRLAGINGRPGIIGYSRDRPDSVLALEIAGGKGRPPRAKPRQAARHPAAELKGEERRTVKTRMMTAEVQPDGYRKIDDLERRTVSAESPREGIRYDGQRKKGRRCGR